MGLLFRAICCKLAASTAPVFLSQGHKFKYLKHRARQGFPCDVTLIAKPQGGVWFSHQRSPVVPSPRNTLRYSFSIPLCVNPSRPSATLLSSLLPSRVSCNPLRSAGACAFPTFRRTFRVYELLIGYRPFLFFPQRHPRGSTRARTEGYGRARIVDCVLFTRSTQGRSIAPRISR